MGRASLFLLLLAATAVHAQQAQPDPIPPLPTPQQVAWHDMETYAFIHFGTNTFLDREWGYGDASPETFCPTRLDCEQWVRVCKAAGMKGIILTAKHHDGFCLWPSKYTDYSILRSPYKDGKGDIVGELAAACQKHGLKMGLYLSPWDRHQASYGTPLYVEYFHAQLEELLTLYGPLFEIWFDGANGGDGWYGGRKESRRIDRRTYYDLPRAFRRIHELQPDAVIFSDGGPGCRWVGNEKGHADPTNWAFLRSGEVYPGYDRPGELQSGHADGDQWVPAECDVSIRPGWFYHEKEDGQVKSVEQLVDLYYRSVGRNATLLLNIPVNREGLIHPTDSARAVDFHRQIVRELGTNLLQKAKKTEKENRLDITFPRSTKLNRLMLCEDIRLGQRVKAFRVEYHDGKQWQPIDVGEPTTTIGHKRLLRFPTVSTRLLRVSFTDTRGPVLLRDVGAYYVP